MYILSDIIAVKDLYVINKLISGVFILKNKDGNKSCWKNNGNPTGTVGEGPVDKSKRFKKDTNPKYICYCNQVTEQQIIDAMLHKSAKNMKDVIAITGAMKNGECEIKNPSGKCCGPDIQKIINKTLNNNN